MLYTGVISDSFLSLLSAFLVNTIEIGSVAFVTAIFSPLVPLVKPTFVVNEFTLEPPVEKIFVLRLVI